MNHRLLYWMMVVNQPTSPREFLQPYKKQYVLRLAINTDLYSCRCFSLLHKSVSLLRRYIYFCFRITFVLSHKYYLYLSACIWKLGCKDFGAPKIKFRFTAQNIHIGIRRRLMCVAYRSDNLSIFYNGVTTKLIDLMLLDN